MVIGVSGTQSDSTIGILDRKTAVITTYLEADGQAVKTREQKTRADVLASTLTGSDSCYHISAVIATAHNLRVSIAGPASVYCTDHCEKKTN